VYTHTRRKNEPTHCDPQTVQRVAPTRETLIPLLAASAEAKSARDTTHTSSDASFSEFTHTN
jgi:hypothetical protein